MAETCGEFVSWWDGEYEGNCELPAGHDGDHWDGLSWFNDEHDLTDADHDGPPGPVHPGMVAAIRLPDGKLVDQRGREIDPAHLRRT